MRVNETTLRALLRLNDTGRIIGARVEGTGDDASIVFAFDIPDAPAGAVSMRPSFTHSGGPDPVSLAHITWRLRDGSDTTTTPGEPA